MIYSKRNFILKWVISLLLVFISNLALSIPLTYAIQLTEEEKNWITQSPPLRYPATNALKPFSYDVGDEIVGYSIDYLNIISDRTGLTFKPIKGFSWDEYLIKAQQGDIDLLHSIRMRDDLRPFLDFSIPYHSEPSDQLYANESAQEITSIEQLREKVITVQRDFVQHHYFIKHYPDLKLLIVDSVAAGIKSVLTGDSDYFYCSPKLCNSYIKQNFITNIAVKGSLGIESLDALNFGHFATQKSQPILNSIINKAIMSIGDTELELLKFKWFYATENEGSPQELSPEEKEWVLKNQRIAFSLTTGVPPLGYVNEDGVNAGVTSDILKRFSEAFGIETHLKSFDSFGDALQSVYKGEVEFIPGVNISPQRRDKLLFTKPFIKYSLALYTHKDQPVISDLDSMSGMRLAVMNGGAVSSQIAKKYPEIKLVKYSSIQAFVKALINQEVDAIIANPYFIDYIIKTEGIDSINTPVKTEYSYEYAMGVHPSNPELVSLLNRTLSTIDDDQISLMVDKWMNIKVVKDRQWVNLVIIGSISAFIVIITLLITHIRSRKNALITLSATQNKLTDAQRVAQIGNWDIDAEYTISSLSEQAANILGIARNKPLNKSDYLRLINKKDQEHYLKTWSGALETGLINIEYRIGEKDYRWINEIAELSFDSDGNFIGGSGTIQDISAFKLVESQLITRQNELRQLTTQLITVQEEERKRVARELHDDLSQRLAVAAIDVGTLKNSVKDDVICESLTNINRSIAKIAEDTHALSRRLHPSILDDLGLIQALKSEIHSFQKREEITVQFICSLSSIELKKDTALVVFRIVQEGLRNVAKYSEASQAEVTLAVINKQLVLQIKDDGMGFDTVAAMAQPGLGLKSMSERTSLVDGTFSIQSKEYKGTTIDVIIPIVSTS